MVFRFANCELDADRHTLRVDGVAQPVEPQVFDLLTLLARHPGELITRDRLVEEIWQGRIVSESAIAARINAARKAVGDDGRRQAIIATVTRRGVRLAVPVAVDGASAPEAVEQRQTVAFCRSFDGTAIAYARSGRGPQLIRAGHWLTHLEHDWSSPIWAPLFHALGKRVTLLRYDQRGNGLSDWDVGRFDLEAYVADLEAVVDAAGEEQFFLYGSSQGTPIAITYAVRYPARVMGLILQGGYVTGRMVRSEEARRESEALQTLIGAGWGDPSHPFVRAFTSFFIPDADPAMFEAMVTLQRMTTSPENAVRLRAAADSLDVAEIVGQVSCPTLVVHSREDGVQPIAQGRALARSIPGARFVMLESRNHVTLCTEPAFQRLVDEIGLFCGDA